MGSCSKPETVQINMIKIKLNYGPLYAEDSHIKLKRPIIKKTFITLIFKEQSREEIRPFK